MRKASVTMAACATLLWAGTALAAQEKCDYSRITAWKVYASCVDSVVAKRAKGDWSFLSNRMYAAFAKCRHTYFKKWAALQTKTSTYAGSTCIGSRFTDQGDGSVRDNLTGLMWEKKTTDSSIHNMNNVYTWGTGLMGYNKEDGTAFTTFLTGPATGLNVVGFASASGWRLPSLAELQTIVLDFTCTGPGVGTGGGTDGGPSCRCPSIPCVDPALDAPTTQPDGGYWSSTSCGPVSGCAWEVGFGNGTASDEGQPFTNYVRAVRGGL
jgi:hypothetical protein